MKKIFTLISVLIITNVLFAQTSGGKGNTTADDKNTDAQKSKLDTNIGKSFYFNNDYTPIWAFKLETIHTTEDVKKIIDQKGNLKYSKFNQAFTVEEYSPDSTYYIVRIWNYRTPFLHPSQKEKNKELMTTLNFIPIENKQVEKTSTNLDSTRYLIKKKGFVDYCKEYKKVPKLNWTEGTLTMPFKLRPSTGVFEQSANLGLIFGFAAQLNWNQPNWHWGFYVGASATSNTLDSATTKGTEKKSTTITTFTPSLNFIISYKQVQVILGTGWDFLVGEQTTLTKNWIYNNVEWIGLGIGINIFNTSTTQTGGGNTQKSKSK